MTACSAPVLSKCWLDELTARIAWLEQPKFAKPLVQIVDREADSVAHMRQWQAENRNWLLRVKAGSTASYEGQSQPLSQIGNGLIYKETRKVEYKGKPAIQWIAQASVVLTRKAQPFLKDRTERKTRHRAGEPLPARLIVSRIMGADGQLLAQWYLLSNLEQKVTGERLALWYYWRWRIESYFKLLKGGGHQLENWQQESGEAVFKRLLIASQACAVSWRLMRAEGEFAEQTRDFLVRLSGRQMKRSQPVTVSAVLAGLYMLLAMCETLEQYTPQELAGFAKEAIGWVASRRL